MVTTARSTAAAVVAQHLADLVTTTPGATDVVAVGGDGLVFCATSRLEREDVEQIGALASAFVSLGRNAARSFGFAGLRQVVVSLEQGYLFLSSLPDGCTLAMAAERSVDVGRLGQRTSQVMAELAPLLDQDVVAELRAERLS